MALQLIYVTSAKLLAWLVPALPIWHEQINPTLRDNRKRRTASYI